MRGQRVGGFQHKRQHGLRVDAQLVGQRRHLHVGCQTLGTCKQFADLVDVGQTRLDASVQLFTAGDQEVDICRSFFDHNFRSVNNVTDTDTRFDNRSNVNATDHGLRHFGRLFNNGREIRIFDYDHTIGGAGYDAGRRYAAQSFNRITAMRLVGQEVSDQLVAGSAGCTLPHVIDIQINVEQFGNVVEHGLGVAAINGQNSEHVFRFEHCGHAFKVRALTLHLLSEQATRFVIQCNQIDAVVVGGDCTSCQRAGKQTQ